MKDQFRSFGLKKIGLFGMTDLPLGKFIGYCFDLLLSTFMKVRIPPPYLPHSPYSIPPGSLNPLLHSRWLPPPDNLRLSQRDSHRLRKELIPPIS